MVRFNPGFDALMTTEKATSESIPSGHEDLASFLEIADCIKGKQGGLTAEKAMKTFKNRLRHHNPHVQLLTLKVRPQNELANATNSVGGCVRKE